MTPQLVIFDCDGVLVETESVTNAVLSEYFSSRGAPMDSSQVHKLFAGGTMKGAGEEAVRLGAYLDKDWLREIYDLVFAKLRLGVEVFDGLLPLLDELDKRGIATAIASNGPMAKMEISLGPSGLWDRFYDRIYSGQTHAAPKPSPALLLHAARIAQIDPVQCVMIDDTTAGTRAAAAAGMPAIGFAAASDAERLRAQGVPVALHMQEVAHMLGLG